MKILVIDDLRNLKEQYAKGNEVTVARTSWEGLELLAAGNLFDVIYFDHDLGGDDTTRIVVRYLEERAFFGAQVPVGQCIVHTSNNSGGDWIMSGLREAGYKPVRVYAGDYFTA